MESIEENDLLKLDFGSADILRCIRQPHSKIQLCPDKTMAKKISRHGKSVMADMDKIQEEINKFYHRLETLEKALKYRPLTNDEREQTEKEVIEIRKILKKQENDLDALRNENRSNAFIAVILIILFFLVFGLYHMYLNATKTESSV